MSSVLARNAYNPSSVPPTAPTMESAPSFIPIRTRGNDGSSVSSGDSTYGSAGENCPTATHDISRVSYHVKHLESFVQTLQESASKAFPNQGRSSQRYSKVQALLLHWKSDDLFVLPELEDLEKCLREDFKFDTEIFPIPSDNPHLELMLKIGDLIKKHESEDTLFIVYYGGHARIDESRQSTWCATRRSGSPWLQWSAIQTLLERSMSDVLILLDCCAGAASATFPSGQSITETISASSWDAIAPDPGRYSFTNALIEVLQEWRFRTFSAAMLHAEVLARLKHPRPILINGKHFEARSTPVHFMMTSNHKAPSIELTKVIPQVRRPLPPPQEPDASHCPSRALGAAGSSQVPDMRQTIDGDEMSELSIPTVTEPNEDRPHVMISLALEDDQRLDLNAWEQWLANFPALAKHVKIQGVFKSHSTLLLLSLPVMVWDLLPDDPAYSFVAFIRSNNLLRERPTKDSPVQMDVPIRQGQFTSERPSQTRPDSLLPDNDSLWTVESTLVEPTPPHHLGHLVRHPSAIESQARTRPPLVPVRSGTSAGIRTDYPRPLTTVATAPSRIVSGASKPTMPSSSSASALGAGPLPSTSLRNISSAVSLSSLPRHQTGPPTLPALSLADADEPSFSDAISRTMIINNSRSHKSPTFLSDDDILEGPAFAKHVTQRLEEYFQKDSEPNMAVAEFLASNLGVEFKDIHLWFHHRRQVERMKYNLLHLKIDDHPPEAKDGPRMILPGHLNSLLEASPAKSVLIVDLRSCSEFEKSHIHEAINLRVPLTVLQTLTLETVQDTLVDDQSRRAFSKWFQARCVVFYDRGLEFSWECPVADALYDKFRRKGWMGQAFILKGHYREFSNSFEKYITGIKMSQEAKDHLDSLRQQPTPTPEELQRRHEQYDQWLRAFESEDRAPVVELIPSRRIERAQDVEQRQRDIEVEFESRFPAIYKKAQALLPAETPRPPPTRAFTSSGEKGWGSRALKGEDVNFDMVKAGLVAPLAAGLEKMREAGFSTGEPTKADLLYRSDSYSSKLGEGRYSEDYDEIDPKGEGLKNDPAFQKAGAGARTHEGGTDGLDDGQKRAKKKPFFGRFGKVSGAK